MKMAHAGKSLMKVFFILATWVCLTSGRLNPVEEKQQDVYLNLMPAYAMAQKAQLLQQSSKCRAELQEFITGIANRKTWALNMLDASGQPESNFMDGNSFWLGSKVQCQDLSAKVRTIMGNEYMQNISRFRPPEQEFPPYPLHFFVADCSHTSSLQYHIRIPDEDILWLGLCFPASCSKDDLGLLLSNILEEKSLLVEKLYSMDIKLIRVRDLNPEPDWLNKPGYIATGIAVLISCLLAIIGTICDLLYQPKGEEPTKVAYENNNKTVTKDKDKEEQEAVKEESLALRIVKCFSIYSNTKKIFDSTANGKDVRAIHGLKFLGMVWIIMAHQLFYSMYFIDNRIRSYRLSDSVSIQVLNNAVFSVDSFFCLSGFLLCYTYLKSNEAKKQQAMTFRQKVFEFFTLLTKRCIRLVPAYLAVIAIASVNYAWYDQTSVIVMGEKINELCSNYWWRNILFINNFFPRAEMCLSWSWYLSNDTQFFTLGVILLLASTTHMNAVATSIFSTIVLSIALTSYKAYSLNYIPTLDLQFEYLEILYDQPWYRINPYLLGMVGAYVIVKMNSKFSMSKSTKFVCWCLAIVGVIYVLAGVCDKERSLVYYTVHTGITRTIWGLWIVWLVFLCTTENASIINNVLSWKVWVPLSRLTYCAYLVNPLVITTLDLNAESPIHTEILRSATMAFGTVVNSFIAAYLLALLFETPYLQLLGLLFGSHRRRK